MKYLKIQSLKKGYSDPREVLLHAAFQTLVDFVNEEMFKCVDWQADEYHQNIYNESMTLKNWWEGIRPNRKDPLDDPSVDAPPFTFEKNYEQKMEKYTDAQAKAWNIARKESNRLENEWNGEDDDQLHRLINIRLGMWT